MENINKVITMGGHIMIFLIAVSIAVFLYQTLIASQDAILLSSESYSREAEHVKENLDTKRIIYGSEVIAFIVSTVESSGYTGDTIVINDVTYSKNEIKYTSNFATGIELDAEYSVKYEFDSTEHLKVTYTKY